VVGGAERWVGKRAAVKEGQG
ncbi:Hypothetical protein KLENKIAIHU_4931, partial [Klenkia terrae]